MTSRFGALPESERCPILLYKEQTFLVRPMSSGAKYSVIACRIVERLGGIASIVEVSVYRRAEFIKREETSVGL
jgi:hypothetical protein